MKHKPIAYDTEDQPMPTAAEPIATYGQTAINGNEILSGFNNPDFTQKKPLGFDQHYRVLKDKADKVYGKDRCMTPEEYFGKLWYVVEGLYEHV